MSGPDPRGGGRARDDSERPPMLILGEDLPDLEDTTPEELARLEAELEERRADLTRQAAQEQEQARQRLAAEREQAERELARRQRAVDDAERALIRSQRRLRRDAARSGRPDPVPHTAGSSRAPGGSPSSSLLASARERNARRVPRLATALAMLVLGTTCLGGALALTHRSADPTAVAQALELGQVRDALDDAVLAFDRDVAARGLPADGPGDPTGTTPESIDLAEEVIASSEGLSGDTSADIGTDVDVDRLTGFTDAATTLLTSEQVTELQLVTGWSEQRDELDSVLYPFEVRDAFDQLDPAGPASTVLLWSGVGLLALAAFVLARNGARLAAVGAAAALVPAAVIIVATPPIGPGFRDAVEASRSVDAGINTLVDTQGTDLEILLGASSVDPWYDQEVDYWGQDYFVGDDQGSRALSAVEARARIAGAREETAPADGLPEATADYLDAVQALVSERHEELDAARTAVTDAADGGPVTVPLTALVLVPVLALGGLGAEAWRRRREGSA